MQRVSGIEQEAGGWCGKESNTGATRLPPAAQADLGVLRRKGGGAHATRVVRHGAAASSLHRELGHKGAAVHCGEGEQRRERGRWAAPASGGGPVWFGFEPRRAADSFYPPKPPHRDVSGAPGPRTWPAQQLPVADLLQHGLRRLAVPQHCCQPVSRGFRTGKRAAAVARAAPRLCRPWASWASVSALERPSSATAMRCSAAAGRGRLKTMGAAPLCSVSR